MMLERIIGQLTGTILLNGASFNAFAKRKKAKGCMKDTNFKITKMIGENINEKSK